MFDKSGYIVELSKIAKGIRADNTYEIKVDKSLFDNFIEQGSAESEDIIDVRADVKLNAVKGSHLIELYFVFNGEIDVRCSRCLAPMSVKIKNKKTSLYIKLGEKFEETDVNQWIVDANENEIDLSNYIYEELRVEIPIAPVHKRIENCDEEMLDKLSHVNKESLKDKQEIDPRWEQLKKLL